ncbi:MAG: hypothetical protein KJZ87_19015 [Thermoguttaceae bacterium]|nr:hypothetical protein [Thermoguttaceae bacterium]
MATSSSMLGDEAFVLRYFGNRGDACIGSINEIYDAEYPFTPRGCIAQALSVAEVLRALVKTAECDDSARAADAAC